MRRLFLTLAVALGLPSCVHVTVSRRVRSDARTCFPRVSPSPVDSVACVRVAVDALSRETGDRYAYVARFRETADSVFVLLAGGPSPPWVGGGGLVVVTRQSGAAVLELYQ